MARVLFVTSSFPSSREDGVCGYLFDLARELVEAHGHEVRILAPMSAGTADDESFRPVSVTRFSYVWPGSRRFAADLDSGEALRTSATGRLEGVVFQTALTRAVRRAVQWPHLVVSHWLVPSGLAVARARHPRIPHIAVSHGGDAHQLSSMRGGAAIARWVLDRTDRLVVVAEYLRGLLPLERIQARGSVSCIAMGASLGPPADAGSVTAFRERHSKGGRCAVLFLGRLVPIKGVDALLEAAALEPEIDIWIAGDGPGADRLRAQSEAARLRALFLGRLDRPARRVALDAADAVVVPSQCEVNGREEGSPVVVAEALAAGKPVIATRTGALGHVLRNEVDSLLVEAGNTAGLAAALGRIGRDPALRDRLAAGAREAGVSMTMAATARHFDGLIRELVK